MGIQEMTYPNWHGHCERCGEHLPLVEAPVEQDRYADVCEDCARQLEAWL